MGGSGVARRVSICPVACSSLIRHRVADDTEEVPYECRSQTGGRAGLWRPCSLPCDWGRGWVAGPAAPPRIYDLRFVESRFGHNITGGWSAPGGLARRALFSLSLGRHDARFLTRCPFAFLPSLRVSLWGEGLNPSAASASPYMQGSNLTERTRSLSQLRHLARLRQWQRDLLCGRASTLGWLLLLRSGFGTGSTRPRGTTRSSHRAMRSPTSQQEPAGPRVDSSTTAQRT